jgi:transposase
VQRLWTLPQTDMSPTKALNNLIKRIKRIGFGFRNFENYVALSDLARLVRNG